MSWKEKPEIPDQRVDKLVKKYQENATAGTARLTQNGSHGLTWLTAQADSLNTQLGVVVQTSHKYV